VTTEPEWPDLEQWLIAMLSTSIISPEAGASVWIDVDEPLEQSDAGYVVIVRYDGGGRLGVVTEQARIGIRVRGPNTDLGRARRGGLARQIKRLIATCPAPGRACPLAAVTDQNGPYRTSRTDAERPENYQTAELIIAGN